MAQYIKQGDIFGRIGTNLGKGLAEQLPKEVERGRLSAALQNLGQQKGLTPFQQFSGLVSAAHEYPQVVQSGENLLRQQAIIDSVNATKNQQPQPSKNLAVEPKLQPNQPKTATTPESTRAALQPYIPPSGPEQEQMARDLMAKEPLVYPSIEAARAAISNQVAGNTNQSNALLQKRELEESVQNRAEDKLREEIKTVGAGIPGTLLSQLQQKAVDAVANGELSPDEAKIKYGKEATQISQDFSNISGWGGITLPSKSPKEILDSIRAVQFNAKKGGYRKQAADAMIADNNVTPQFAYASMYPIHEEKQLNDEIKSLPNLWPSIEKVVGAGPGLAGAGISRPKIADVENKTLKVAPTLAKLMGKDSSPLSIAYELEKKGYDPNVWKKYLLDNALELNLGTQQIDELQKPQPGFFGWLNDWYLRSFSGVK